MQDACAIASWTVLVSTNPLQRDHILHSRPLDRRADATALGTIAVELGTQRRELTTGLLDGADRRLHPLLRDEPAGEHCGVAPARFAPGLQRPGVHALEHGHVATVALVAQPLGVQPAKAERALGNPQAGSLDQPSDEPTPPAQVLVPVFPGPCLEPVDDQPEVADPLRRGRREQREIRERRRVDRVVVSAVAQQVPENAGAENERRPDLATARLGVQREPRSGHDDADAGDARIDAAIPLPQVSDRSPRARPAPAALRGCDTSARPRRRYAGTGSRRRCRSSCRGGSLAQTADKLRNLWPARPL